MPLSKADILKGTKNVKEVMIESLGDTVWLRGLSYMEHVEIESLEFDGASMNDTEGKKVTMDMGKVLLNSGKAQVKAATYGLNNEKNEKWAENEVASLPREVVKEIAQKVLELTGVSSNLEKFRETNGAD